MQAQLYFSGTRFRDVAHDQWFVPFEARNASTHYTDRRGTIADKLDVNDRFSSEDVQKVSIELSSGTAPGRL
jgi:hypothetical protein